MSALLPAGRSPQKPVISGGVTRSRKVVLWSFPGNRDDSTRYAVNYYVGALKGRRIIFFKRLTITREGK
ncbi:MAG: hypothetical protein ACFFCW_17835 [Candidatus Hodarchaeota archaeon]